MGQKNIPVITNQSQLIQYLQTWRAGLRQAVKSSPNAPIPFNFRTTPVRGHIQLDWAVVKNSQGYELFRSPTPDMSAAVKIQISDPKQIQFIDNVQLSLTASIEPVAGSVVRAAGVTTITTGAFASGGFVATPEPHGLSVGQWISVFGVTDTSFNGIFSITAVTSTTLSYAQPGLGNASSTNGWVTPVYFYKIHSTAGTASKSNSIVGPDSGVISGFPLDPADTITQPKANYDTVTNDKSQTQTSKGNYNSFGKNK